MALKKSGGRYNCSNIRRKKRGECHVNEQSGGFWDASGVQSTSWKASFLSFFLPVSFVLCFVVFFFFLPSFHMDVSEELCVLEKIRKSEANSAPTCTSPDIKRGDIPHISPVLSLWKRGTNWKNMSTAWGDVTVVARGSRQTLSKEKIMRNLKDSHDLLCSDLSDAGSDLPDQILTSVPQLHPSPEAGPTSCHP